MSRPSRRPLRLAAFAVLMGGILALAGCGVRGPLEPPPDTPLGQPGPDGKMPKDTGPVKPDKPFILDPLL
ncbi:LPS translocon maturation chaperone LptM [Ancylobacter radicis]|uniref:Lipoprotein n=1 Tax=Ancylobacter radicis TaxID=2836179 RepID=A0ABS5R2W7_9HYPH|nr:lipoprotein [Ancylobacter radicis]MBS9476005.1 lipoprotein [Ancylobacter radicis]